MATKNNPGTYDCYANAEPDEPMFVLLGRDRTAPGLVRTWAASREVENHRRGGKQTDKAKIAEARACADAMEAWQREHPKKP